MIGPAAMKGPTPGIANVPIPASQPSAPPRRPPVPAPTVAPSGALVDCSWAKSRDVPWSGKRAEMSLFENPALRRSSTIAVACARELAIHKTDLAIIPPCSWFYWSVARDFELAVHPLHAARALGERLDLGLLV